MGGVAAVGIGAGVGSWKQKNPVNCHRQLTGFKDNGTKTDYAIFWMASAIRDFLRLALFFAITPFFAALSKTEEY